MSKEEQDIIRKLQKLGERIDLVQKNQGPPKDYSFEPIKAIVQKKWGERHKEEAKKPVPEHTLVYFPCPSCRMRLGIKLNNRGHAIDTDGTRIAKGMICHACGHLMRRSFFTRIERKARAAWRQGLDKSRPLIVEDEESI